MHRGGSLCEAPYSTWSAAERQREDAMLLVEWTADDDGEFAREALGDRAGDRHFSCPFKSFDRSLGLAVEHARRPDLAVAVVRERTLHRRNALGRCERLVDRIAARRRLPRSLSSVESFRT